MAAPKITLYLDIVSPFAYMGYYVLKVCLLTETPYAGDFCSLVAPELPCLQTGSRPYIWDFIDTNLQLFDRPDIFPFFRTIWNKSVALHLLGIDH